MATKVARTGIKRESGFLYFLDKKGDISRVAMARGGGSQKKGKPQKVEKAGVKREDGWLYFIDKKGNVCKVKMKRSKARRKTARKTTTRRRTTARRKTKKKTPWFAKLPPELRNAIRARSQRRAPRAYESRLRRYFESLD